MLVNENSSGTWNLYADVRSNETYYGSFTINIAHQDEEDIEPVSNKDKNLVSINTKKVWL